MLNTRHVVDRGLARVALHSQHHHQYTIHLHYLQLPLTSCHHNYIKASISFDYIMYPSVHHQKISILFTQMRTDIFWGGKVDVKTLVDEN